MTDKPMTMKDRIQHVKGEIVKCEKNLDKYRNSRKVDDDLSYGFEQGLMGALMDELQFLEKMRVRND